MAEPSPNRGDRPPMAIEQQHTHAVTVRFTAAEARALKRRAAERSCTVAALVRANLAQVPGAALVPEPTASAEAVARRVELRRVARLLNDAVRAVHALRGRPDSGTVGALRWTADPVAHELGGGRDRSHHRVRTRHRGDGLLHRPRPDVAQQSPAHDLGMGGMVRLPRHPDRGHRPDGPRDAGADRRRPGAEGAGRHQRPRAQAEEPVHAHRAELAGGDRGAARSRPKPSSTTGPLQPHTRTTHPEPPPREPHSARAASRASAAET